MQFGLCHAAQQSLMPKERPATPPLSTKLNNTDEAVQVTPFKLFKFIKTTAGSLKMQGTEDADVSRMSPSLEDAVHALTTLKSKPRWNCVSKRQISGSDDDAKPPKKRDMKKFKGDVERPFTYQDLHFSSLNEAKNAFESHLHAIGVFHTDDVYTVRVMTDITDVPYYAVHGLKWMYVRCFYKKIDKFVRTKVIDIVPVINKRGSVRQTYKVSNDFIIKQIHHTCVALEHDNVCRNCNHPKWNSRCSRGHTTFFICACK